LWQVLQISGKATVMVGSKFVVASVFAVMTTAAYAQDNVRKTLPGYRGLSFGMTEQEARRVTQLGGPISESQNVRFEALAPVVVDGVSYKLSITLSKGRLDTVAMTSRTQESKSDCKYNFERVVSLIQSKYGSPDRAPDVQGLSGIASIRSVTFTFRDGNSIIASEAFVKSCLVNIAYTQGKKGESF
jgi:hypothetical protein